MTEPVYLTFDDGPDPEWTPRILDMLDEADVKATFFVIGALATQHPGIVRQIEARGHEVGNHSFSHPHPRLLSDDRAREEVNAGAGAIADILGHPPRLFRSPHGTRHPAMFAAAEALGETVVHWQVSAIDWGLLGRAGAIARRLKRVKPGDIVLMHDGGRGINHPEQLSRVLPNFLTRFTTGELHAAPLP